MSLHYNDIRCDRLVRWFGVKLSRAAITPHDPAVDPQGDGETTSWGNAVIKLLSRHRDTCVHMALSLHSALIHWTQIIIGNYLSRGGRSYFRRPSFSVEVLSGLTGQLPIAYLSRTLLNKEKSFSNLVNLLWVIMFAKEKCIHGNTLRPWLHAQHILSSLWSRLKSGVCVGKCIKSRSLRLMGGCNWMLQNWTEADLRDGKQDCGSLFLSNKQHLPSFAIQ